MRFKEDMDSRPDCRITKLHSSALATSALATATLATATLATTLATATLATTLTTTLICVGPQTRLRSGLQGVGRRLRWL